MLLAGRPGHDGVSTVIYDNNTPYYINYGGGANSGAILIRLIADGVRPPVGVYFSDTGGERPDVYETIEQMSHYLMAAGWPPVTVLRWVRKRAPHTGEFIPLEQWCLDSKTLPSLSFGRKGCSVKWKGQVVDEAVLKTDEAVRSITAGVPVVRVLGYDADEPHRWNRSKDDSNFVWWAPLVEWDMGRHECEQLMSSAGFAPRKSSCFFCPSMKAHEIRELMVEYPDLLERALALEANAELDLPERGLGGHGRKWADIVWYIRSHQGLFYNELEREFDRHAPDLACGCLD